MKKILLLFALFFNLLITNAQKNDYCINKNYHEVSIDATNKDFSDLQFLKKELEGKNVVAIGEQTHDDGSSFEGRNRLIQFLISKMGYEAILFEAGMFDVGFGAHSYNSSKTLTLYKNHYSVFGVMQLKINPYSPLLIHKKNKASKFILTVLIVNLPQSIVWNMLIILTLL